MESPKSPKLEMAWVRGKSSIDFSRPNVFFNLGMRGSGKSALLELFASRYLDNGGKVFDLFAARDSESLGWLRSPYAKKKRIILLHGDLVEIESKHESIKARKFKASDLARGDIFISASALYSDIDDEFDCVNHILDVLWARHHWTEPIFVVVREAANLVYSRLKLRKSQLVAKSEIIYMLRESRHCGLALGLDTIKHTSIDIDIRVLTDYLIIKNTGMHGLPRDLWWIYRMFDPHALRKFHPREFVILDRRGSMGLGMFALPPWHKREAEDIVAVTGLKIKYYRPTGERDYVGETVAEALRALPSEPEPNQVSAWIKENKRMSISPVAVGRQIQLMGYRSDLIFKDGRMKRVIRKNP